MSRAMIMMTTSSSTRVNPREPPGLPFGIQRLMSPSVRRNQPAKSHVKLEISRNMQGN